MVILSLQSISRDVADNVSHPRRLDPTMELITHSFVLYLQHGRHDVKCKPSIGLKSYYSNLMDGNYWAGAGLLARKMAAVKTKTSKVPTGVTSFMVPILCGVFLVMQSCSKGLIPRQRNSLREAVYAKYGWLHMNNSIEFSLREKKIRFGSE